MTRLYKVTGPRGEAIHGGTGRWDLPRGSRPGKWMPRVEPDVCRQGYHLVTVDHLAAWLRGRRDLVVWEAEGRGLESTDDEGKTAFAEARLLRRTPIAGEVVLRLLASDFAAHVHDVWSERFPDDSRPADAIRAVRLWASGRISESDRTRAAWAAWAAGATRAAGAAWAAWDAEAAWAAWDAEAAEAAGAAGAARAARDARDARDAERKWQARHIQAVLDGEKQAGRVRIARAKRGAS